MPGRVRTGLGHPSGPGVCVVGSVRCSAGGASPRFAPPARC